MPAVIEPNAVYLSPLGRTCRLAPSKPDQAPARTTYATFVYCRADTGPGQGTFADAFTLSSANFHLLRRLW